MDSFLSLPTVSFKQLSFTKPSPASLKAWSKQLPVADIEKTAQALYLAFGEISELNIKPEKKLALVNTLDPLLDRCLQGLEKSYLNHSLVLPEPAYKKANLCYGLMKRRLAILFWIIETQKPVMARKFARPKDGFSKVLSLAFEQSLKITTLNALLYRPCENGFWRFNHQLISYAYEFKLIKSSSTPDNNEMLNQYASLLLWGSINSNQLRQKDILFLRDKISHWASLSILLDDSSKHSFGINLDSDNPPQHLSYIESTKLTPCLYIDTSNIIADLNFTQQKLEQLDVIETHELTTSLLKHLTLAWRADIDRSFMRLDSDDQIDLCIGMNAAHHYIGNEQAFDDIVFGNNIVRRNAAKQRAIQLEDVQRDTQNSLFSPSSTSPSQGSFQVALETVDYHLPQSGKPAGNRFKNYNVNIVNLSPGGYCLSWDKIVPPSSIRNHELVAVKEEHHPLWHLGCIRWVKQSNTNDGIAINMGIELLSPSPKAYGARWLNDNNEAISGYIKVLQLPEIKTMGKPSTIILAETKPKPSSKLMIESAGYVSIIELKDCVQNNGAFQQYSFVNAEILEESDSSVTISNSVGQSSQLQNSKSTDHASVN